MQVRSSLRRAALLAAIVVAMVVAVDVIGFGLPSGMEAATGAQRMGLTFSQRQSDYLNLEWTEVYDATLGLAPGLMRLGAYWDHIERTPGVYDFSLLELQLDQAERLGQEVVVTVGMKAPRWPEYYLPLWLDRRVGVETGGEVTADPEVRARTLAFVEQAVLRLRDREAVVAWQVENEPLDPSGPKNWRIGRDFLAQEVALVRRLDDRPIVVTAFLDVGPLMNTPRRRHELRERAGAILDEADVLGIDLYPSRGFRSYGHDWYFNWPAWAWEPAVRELRELALSRGKAAWITEAQAEPWEPERLVYTDVPLSRSVQPPVAVAAVERLAGVGFDTILLWGVEHWYMRREIHQQSDWWTPMSAFFPDLTASADVSGPVSE